MVYCSISESMLTGIQTKITEAFDIFDHESNKTVDVREIGTIVRSLGCCPSEAELHDMLAEVGILSCPNQNKTTEFILNAAPLIPFIFKEF